ncbi:AAA family ATPase [Rugamonas sp. A1-17]|nr:AAA family ATPase [Rugamonas sp. A1-17]
MKFQKFTIKNFRGIKDTTLDLSNASGNHINALVGLNESGKTTLLEAINNFSYAFDLRKTDPAKATRPATTIQSYIPIGDRSNFNGTISIEAKISVDEFDWLKIKNYLEEKHKYIEVEKITHFTVNKTLLFENSLYKSGNNIWDLYFRGKKKGQKKQHALVGDEWKKAIDFVTDLMPQIVYFPAEIFEFPKSIYLEEGVNGDIKLTKNQFYYNVLSDILQAVDNKLTVETHILERLNSKKATEKQNMEALLVKVEQHLTHTILTVWESIFGQKLEGKRFRIYVQKDESKRAVLQVKLVDGAEIFDIDERSAGFRWFFVFILITRYRIHRGDPVLFLFDEPAASLHPNAQAQLLKNFEALKKHCQIIYSTHSHYLVNPLWLDSTFIVKNDAIERPTDLFSISSSSTNIRVNTYRKFVGSHPEQYYYYKPVLDFLDFAPAPTDFPDFAVLVEGKSDYFLIKFLTTSAVTDKEIKYFPGGGAGTLDPLITLLSGWGKRFVILLDSDEEGVKQKLRYTSKFENLLHKKIFTLEEIDIEFKGAAIEKILDEKDILKIKERAGLQKDGITKKEMHRAIQEILIGNTDFEISEIAAKNINSINNFLSLRLNEIK